MKVLLLLGMWHPLVLGHHGGPKFSVELSIVPRSLDGQYVNLRDDVDSRAAAGEIEPLKSGDVRLRAQVHL